MVPQDEQDRMYSPERYLGRGKHSLTYGSVVSRRFELPAGPRLRKAVSKRSISKLVK